MKIIFVVVWVTSLMGCASLKSVSMTQVPVNRSHPVEADSFSWGILGIFFTNSFADEAVANLKAKCPHGKLSGVYTKYENRFYLLWATRSIEATGYCESPITKI